MATELSTRLRHAAKTLNQWKSITTIPKLGEVCLECDSSTSPINFKIKIGDGVLPYYLEGGTIGTNYLPYYSATDTEGQDISTVISNWVADNLNVGTAISSITISGSTITVNSFKETSGVLGTGATSTIALEGTYNASTNKIATQSTVSDAIEALDATEFAIANVDTTTTVGETKITIKGVQEIDGIVSGGTSSTEVNILADGSYNASTNKLATESTVSNAISDLDSSVSATSGSVLTGVTQSDGELTAKTEVTYETIAPIQDVAAGSLIDVSVANNTATVNHETVTTEVTDNSSTIAEKEMDIVTGITTDGYGHVTAVTKDNSTNLIAADIKAPVKQTDNTTWNYRQTGGNITIGEDIANVEVLKGNTIVWNQLISLQDLPNTVTQNDVTYTNNGDGSITVSGLASADDYVQIDMRTRIPIGHKALFRSGFTGGSAETYFVNINGVGIIYGGGVISNTESNGDWRIRISVVNGANVLFTTLPQLIDLTLMFGAGNEPSTVEEFQEKYPLPYYNYCPADLLSLGGRQVEMNQLVQNGDFADSSNWRATSLATITVANNECQIVTTGTSEGLRQDLSSTIVSGHKYLIRINAKGASGGEYCYTTIQGSGIAKIDTLTTSYADYYVIGTASSAGNVFEVSTSSATAYVKNAILIDLTQMFGAGSEPDLEQCKQIFTADYYEYNTGYDTNIFNISGESLKLKNTGFNQWDEQWEHGTINNSTGQNNDSTNSACRSINYIKVFHSTTYYLKKPANSSNVRIFYYDSNKSFISYIYTSVSGTFTTPSNCSYIRFYFWAGETIYYNNDICINISDPNRNGTYEPYTSNNVDFYINSIVDGNGDKVFPYGLLKAGDVYDEITSTGVVKRIGVVDLGTLNWGRTETTTGYYRFQGEVNDIKMTSNADFSKPNIKINIDKYTIGTAGNTWGSAMVNNVITVNNSNNYVLVTDNAYTESAAFKIAMSGVMLYYELATPITINFAEVPQVFGTSLNLTYLVDDSGTEQQTPVNGAVPITAPFNGTFIYKSNFKETVLDLIDKVNNAANPVKGINNVNQTVGKLAVYDSVGTVESSSYSASNATIVEGASGNDIILPSVATLITYVNSKLSSALTYKGTISAYSDLPSSGQSTGDMYIVASTFTYDDVTYNAGDFFIWNGSSWDIVRGTTSVVNNNPTLTLNGSTYQVGTVDGTALQVTTPNLDYSSPTASGNSLEFIDTVTQTDGQLSATKKTVPSASTTQTGVTSYVEDIHNSTDTSKTATAKQIWDECDKRNVQFVPTGTVDDFTILTEEEFLAQYTYGVSWTQGGTDVTKVGNPQLISSMPVHNALMACVYSFDWTDTTVSETVDGVDYSITYRAKRKFEFWLDPDDWTKKMDGTASGISNTFRDIAIWNPTFYGKSFEGIASSTDHSTSGTLNEVRISMHKYDDTWTTIKEGYTDFAKMQAIMTASFGDYAAYCKGNPDFSGTNPMEDEMSLSALNTWIDETPRCLVNTNRATAHQYALNSGAHLMSYDEYKWLFCWLPVIEFGTFQVESNTYFDWQDGANVNIVQRDSLSTPPAFGYYGLYSANYSSITGTCGWNMIPNGYTNALGSHTGWVKIKLPNSSSTYDSKIVSRWRGFELQRNIWTNLYGVNPVQTATSGLCDVYTTNNRALWSNSLPLTSGSSTISTYPSTITVSYNNLSTDSPEYIVNTGFTHAGEQHWNGYGYEFDLGSTAEAICKTVGSTSSIKYDYSYGYASNANPRWFIAGGSLSNSGSGGPFYFGSDLVASTASVDVGFRCRWNADEYDSVLN